MGKKLYEVERRFYVLADDIWEAESYQPFDPLSCTNEVIEARTVDHEWWKALPFGEDDEGERTCGEIIKSLSPTPPNGEGK